MKTEPLEKFPVYAKNKINTSTFLLTCYNIDYASLVLEGSPFLPVPDVTDEHSYILYAITSVSHAIMQYYHIIL